MEMSPKISTVSWGAIEAESVGPRRDAKLWPGGGREWDWAETGTHHVPGIQVADVEELLKHGSEVVVLSRGMQLRLQTCRETLEYLEKKSIPYHVEETKKAVAIYNDLVKQGKRVGGLFHTTC